jgi:hypothetical protein
MGWVPSSQGRASLARADGPDKKKSHCLARGATKKTVRTLSIWPPLRRRDLEDIKGETTMAITITNDDQIPATQPRASERTQPAGTTSTPVSRTAIWAGRIASGIAVAFLLFDSVIKVLKLAPAVASTVQLGYPVGVLPVIGVIELICLAVYLVPRTAVLGAVLWTGYLGGAIATHLRVGSPLASHTLFPIYIALLLWGGLYLRDRGVRALIPLRHKS